MILYTDNQFSTIFESIYLWYHSKKCMRHDFLFSISFKAICIFISSGILLLTQSTFNSLPFKLIKHYNVLILIQEGNYKYIQQLEQRVPQGKQFKSGKTIWNKYQVTLLGWVLALIWRRDTGTTFSNSLQPWLFHHVKESHQ